MRGIERAADRHRDDVARGARPQRRDRVWIAHGRVREHARAVLEQRGDQVCRVAGRARGDDVGRVGHRHAAELAAQLRAARGGDRGERVWKRGRLFVTARPAQLGELVGDAIGGGAIAIRDADRRPAEPWVVVPWMDHERRRREHATRAFRMMHAAKHLPHRGEEVDRLAAAEDHRQRAPRDDGLQLAEHGADRDATRLATGARVIAMRVGLVRDDRVGELDARAREVAVQVVRCDERSAADHRPRRAQQPRFRIGDAVHAHRTVHAEVHAVERARAAQALDEPRLERFETISRERSARRRPRRQDRHRLDVGATRARGREKAGELGALEIARHLGPVAEQRVAGDVMRGLEVVQRRRDRRQRVGLLRDARERDALHRYSSAISARTLRATSRRTGNFAAMPYIGAEPDFASAGFARTSATDCRRSRRYSSTIGAWFAVTVRWIDAGRCWRSTDQPRASRRSAIA